MMQASLVDFKDIKILPWFACIKLWSFYSPFLLDWGFFVIRCKMVTVS